MKLLSLKCVEYNTMHCPRIITFYVTKTISADTSALYSVTYIHGQNQISLD
jgi:hypothetical protein